MKELALAQARYEETLGAFNAAHQRAEDARTACTAASEAEQEAWAKMVVAREEFGDLQRMQGRKR